MLFLKKRFLLLLIYKLIFCIVANVASAVPIKHNGKGEIKLSKEILNEFYNYITTKRTNNPLNFFITEDHNKVFSVIDKNTDYKGYSGSGPISRNKKKCENKYKQECYLFSNQRFIVWDNGINPIKKKNSLLKSKISYNDFIFKLSELGYIENKKERENNKYK